MSHALRGRAITLSMSTALFAGLLYGVSQMRPVWIYFPPPEGETSPPISVEHFFLRTPPPAQPKAEKKEPKYIEVLAPFNPPKDDKIETKPTDGDTIDLVQPKIVDARWLRKPTIVEMIDFYPPVALCTDNGAMIAHVGALRLAEARNDYAVSVRPRWPLAELSPPAE